jgi:aspartyl-tRNA(Asn)/glutamyl-tRNA(Gln) amidotransferase subunit B
MKTYVPTIGLEIHAELSTKSKMFCGCSNDPDEQAPNVLICPVCMAHPGTLPVINRDAVRHVLRVGCAIGGTLADFSEFDRKNYFYPDIPKSYQISQYKFPLVSGGAIGPVEVTRIHLEEDTGSSAHTEDTSNVDFNRAGVPLMELVTEPGIHDAATAVAFAKELRLLLKFLGASEANLEKGEMRIEANISVAPAGAKLGTKVEVKNLNSFKAVEQAIAHEIQRQTNEINAGRAIRQETRGWDENRQKTFAQRAKEESHDYRYFPDPDLPKLYLREIAELRQEELAKDIPELPWELRGRYIENGLQPQTADLLVADMGLNHLFQEVSAILKEPTLLTLAGNYITSDIVGIMSKSDYVGVPIEKVRASEFAELITLVAEKTISSRGAKDVLTVWLVEGGSPKDLAKRLSLIQISDVQALDTTIQGILTENQNVVADYRAGKEAALQFLVGQGMKATKGAANPELLRQLLQDAVMGTAEK